MTKRDPDPIRIQLTLGLLGFLGVVLTVLATIFGPIIQENLRQKNLPTQTPIVIVASPTQSQSIATESVPAGNPTSTPAPATDTPEPTATFTKVPALGAGVDWLQNCMSTVWKPYPASLAVTDKDGCYLNFVKGFDARDKRLQLYFNEPVSTEEIIGMFVEIPSDGIVDLNVHLNSIKASELRIGVFQEPDVKQAGVMVVIPDGNAKDSAFAVHTMPADKREYISGKFKKDSGDYLITFDVASGSVIVKFEKYTSVKPLNVPSDANGKKWLFIGYKALTGKTNVLDANFFDLKITPR